MTAPAHDTACTPPVLALNDITKTFGTTTALDKVAIEVPEGSFTVILGPAGAGKTTTLRTIAGLDTPDKGTVRILGQDVGKWEPKDRNLAMIFDNLALYPNKNGFMNIANPLLIQGMPKHEVKEQVDEVAAMLKITHLMDRLPGTMSGGERQRIALGRALIRTPNCFLLDEPLSSLDAKLRIELRAELRRLQRDHGRTFLMATPDYTEALAIADTVIMLREGQVIQVDAPQAIYDKPVDREAARFVGAPQINILDARFDPSSNTMEAAGSRLDAPAHFAELLGQNPLGFDLGIRPENLVLGDPGSSTIRGELTDIEWLGLKSVLTVRTPMAELRVMVDSLDVRGTDIGANVGLDIANDFLLLAFDSDSGKRIGTAAATA